jgi:hypothetical protein
VASNTDYQDGGAMHHATRMAEEAQAFRAAVGRQAADLNRSIDLRGRVQRNPLLMIAAAAGVGYLLGGGLFSPLTGRVLRVGLKLAFVPFIRSQLAGIVPEGVHGVAGEGSAGSTF